MSEQSRGFTMIELLMVIIIIAVLGATGLTQFLDFRQEARASSVMQTLTAMRVSIKNQFQQALLRCGASTSAGWTVPDGASLSQAIFFQYDLQRCQFLPREKERYAAWRICMIVMNVKKL